MSSKCNPSVIHTSPNDLHVPKMIWVPLNGFGVLPFPYPYLSKITFCPPHPENLNKYKYNKSLNLKRQRSVIKYVPLCSNIHNQQWSGTSNSFLLMNQQYNLKRQWSGISNSFLWTHWTFNLQPSKHGFLHAGSLLSFFLPHLPTIAKPIQT